MIELKGLVKQFGDLIAVDGIDLVVPKGEFFAVLGPNAAGKTTTIKMMVGLIKPTHGSAVVAGYDIQQNPLKARERLAYVPDFPFLYEKLTPLEFMRFTGQLFKIDPDRVRTEGEQLAKRFHLETFLHKPIEGLSHGTRQRVAISIGSSKRIPVAVYYQPFKYVIGTRNSDDLIVQRGRVILNR